MEPHRHLDLINRLTAAIGADNVIGEDSLIEEQSRTCIPFRQLPAVIVHPLDIHHVREVVLIAREFNVPIWPVSTGKNWGYGETTACYPEGISMLLDRMTKIYHVDEKLGYAVIEPGVTYQMLNDHLKRNGSRLWVDVSGSTQSGSVIGNALDKGRGVTPYADHFGALCGMDVVLPDGQVIETGGGPQGNNNARHVYKWGLGPYLDGIFAQSNYGIVVKAGVWLMPRPQSFDWAVFEYTASEDKFGALIDDMRELCFNGAMRARPHLANDFAMMCIISQYPNELLNGKKYLDDKAMAVWRKKHGVARFTFGCGLYGSKAEVRFQKRELGRVLGKYGMVQFLGAAVKDDLHGKVLRWLAPIANRILGKSASFTDALIPGINLFRGIPTDFFAKQVYFKTFKNKPSENVVDPAKDGCGFLWIGPLVPFESSHINRAWALSKAIAEEHEFDYFLEVIVESPRCSIFLLGVFYDRHDAAECTRAKAWYTHIKDEFLKNGYPAYRTTTMSMPNSLDINPVSRDFLGTVKFALDPLNIIAPGRYGINPHPLDENIHEHLPAATHSASVDDSQRPAIVKTLPEQIDSLFNSLPYVQTAITIGTDRSFPVVVVTLDFQRLAQVMNMPVDGLWDLDEGGLMPQVLKRIDHDLSQKNSQLQEYQRPLGFFILTKAWDMDKEGLNVLHPGLRRRFIEKMINPTLEKLLLQVDPSTRTNFWYVDAGQIKAPLISQPMIISGWARMFVLIGLSLEVLMTVINYSFKGRSSVLLNRKLGQLLRRRLGRLRGPLQKVGQMISHMKDDLPVEMRDELKSLLRDSHPVDPAMIRAIVEEELLRPISSVFSEWRDVPINTASIGQVHFARLHTGEAVAVKVLLPNIEKIAQNDLSLLRVCLPLIARIWNSPNTSSHYEELRTMVLKECDLREEAASYRLFQGIFKDDPDIIIPKVFMEHSTKRMLVTLYIEGETLEEFAKHADVTRRRKIAKAIWEFPCRSINAHAIFNADPHPGNFIICQDKVAVIDFGFCKHWDQEFIDLWKQQTLAGCQGDEAAFITATKAMGFERPGDPDFIRRLMPLYRDIFYRPWLKDADFKITHTYCKEYLHVMFKHVVAAGNVRVPAEFLSLSRLFFEVFAIMAELDVEFNYYQTTIPHIKAVTTPIYESSKLGRSPFLMML